MSFHTLVRKLFAPKPVAPIRRPALGLHQLEGRDVPAIAVIDGVLTITGDALDGVVVVTDPFRGDGGTITAYRVGTRISNGV